MVNTFMLFMHINAVRGTTVAMAVRPTNPKHLAEYVIANVKMWRKLLGWSQADLDASAGFTKGIVASLENRRSRVTIERLAILANAFQIECQELLKPNENAFETPPRGRPKKQEHEEGHEG